MRYRKESLAAFGASVILIAFARSKVTFPILMADRFYTGAGLIEIMALGFYSAFITGKLLDPAGSLKWRQRIWLFFSIIFFGQLILGLSGLEIFLMTGKLHLPIPVLIVGGPLYRGEGLFMPILFSASIILLGPGWCSYLCYIGSWDSALSRLKKKPALSPVFTRWRQPLRAGTLLATIITAPALRILGAPVHAAIASAAIFGITGVLVMIFFSRKTGHMVHCTAYCPIGLLSTVLGKISPFRIKISDNCTSCMACRSACRYDALNEKNITMRKPGMSCTLCGDCISRCGHDAISYGYFSLSPEASRRVFIVMAAVMHTVFLGIARI